MKKAKSVIFLIVVLIMISSTACNKQNTIVEMVEKVEMSSYELSAYDFDYDEYMRDMKNIYISDTEDFYIYSHVIPYSIVSYNTSVDYKKYHNETRKKMYEQSVLVHKVNADISKVYDINDNMKNVYVRSKIDIKIDEKEDEITIAKKYVIIKENDEWKISKYFIDLHCKGEDRKLEYSTTMNDEPIKYIKTISFDANKENK